MLCMNLELDNRECSKGESCNFCPIVILMLEGEQSIEHIPVMSLRAYVHGRLVNVEACIYLFILEFYD